MQTQVKCLNRNHYYKQATAGATFRGRKLTQNIKDKLVMTRQLRLEFALTSNKTIIRTM